MKIFLALLLFTGSALAQLRSDRILNANRAPQNRLTYSGSDSSQRYSLLHQINRDNVNNLSLKWVYRPSSLASVGPEGGPNDLPCPNRTDTEGWRGTTRRHLYDPLILEVFSDVIE